MSRESKILTAGPWGAQATISHYESFGWELLSLNGEDQITMSRETQDEVYADLVKHQAAYEQKMNEFRAVEFELPAEPEFSFPICLILLLIGLIPGIFYIAYKVSCKHDYEEAIKAHYEKLKSLKAEMESIASKSRAIFFSKRA